MGVSPAPTRRWWKRLSGRLSVRTLMLLVLLVGGGVGWKANRARTQRLAFDAVKTAGGAITYDYRYPLDRTKPREPPGPRWLRKMLGNEHFQEVAEVVFTKPVTPETLRVVESFDHLQGFSIEDSSTLGDGLKHFQGLGRIREARLAGSGITDERLAELAMLPDLETIVLQKTAVTDAGLRHLAGLSKLENLAIRPAPGVTDEGLSHLGRLPNLRSLELTGAPGVTDVARLGGTMAGLESLHVIGSGMTDDGLAGLKEMKRLKHLQIQGAKVTDAGLANVSALGSLESLSLNGTELTDAGLEAVRGLSKLRTLKLQKTKVTDVGLARLEGLTHLTDLDVSLNPAVTDAGIDHLGRLTGLEQLYLIRTGLTDAGLAKLGGLKALKNLSVQDTKVTAEGIAALTSVLPSSRIVGGTVRRATGKRITPQPQPK